MKLKKSKCAAKRANIVIFELKTIKLEREKENLLTFNFFIFFLTPFILSLFKVFASD